jgi:hypothetical protein
MTSLFRRSVAAVASAAVMTMLMTGGYPLVAQETGAKSQTSKTGKQAKKADAPASSESSSKSKSTGKTAPPDPTHRVPPGYAKLDLTEKQKDSIYAIQAKYYPRIQSMQKELDGLRAKRESECEAVLTPNQKRMLARQEQEKKSAAEKRKAEAAAKALGDSSK